MGSHPAAAFSLFCLGKARGHSNSADLLPHRDVSTQDREQHCPLVPEQARVGRETGTPLAWGSAASPRPGRGQERVIHV